MDAATAHRDLILDTFSRTAGDFARMPAHSDAASLDLLLDAAAIGAADTVLDVACGPGIVACAAAARAAHVTGVDLTAAMLDQARQLQRERGLSNLSWQTGDALALPFASGSFSVVLSRYAFHHLEQPAAVLSEMVRVCRPGGRIVVADVFVASEAQGAAYDEVEKARDPSHVRALRLDEFAPLFAAAGAPLRAIPARYRLDVDLEELLAASHTPSPAASLVRRLLRADLGHNRTGMAPSLWRRLGEATSRAGVPCRQSKPAHKRPTGATQQKVAGHNGGRMHFSFPVLVAMGIAQ